MPKLHFSTPWLVASLLLTVAAMPASARHASKRWEHIESVDIDLRTIAPGEVKTVSWQGWPVIVLHRTPQQIRELRDADAKALGDPDGSEFDSLIRKEAQSIGNRFANLLLLDQARLEHMPLRSIRDDIFVAINTSPYIGCSTQYVPIADEHAPADWRGGFIDPCRSDRYDLAGRVLKGHTFINNWNLLIPPHVFVDDHTLVIGLGDPPRAVPTTDFLPAIDYPALAPLERLIVATRYGRLDIAQDVLRSGVDVNGRNTKGITPLFEAVVQDHAEIAELLLSSGASPGRSFAHGLTPICLALLSGHIDSLRVLIKHGANVQRNPGINPNCNTTPLILAVTRLSESAALEVVGPLLEAGADPLLGDTDGNAIEHARSVGYTKLERLLVQHAK